MPLSAVWDLWCGDLELRSDITDAGKSVSLVRSDDCYLEQACPGAGYAVLDEGEPSQVVDRHSIFFHGSMSETFSRRP